MPSDHDIAFKAVPGRELKLDIHRPEGVDGPAPTVIYIHAGGWIMGGRAADRVRFEPLLDYGFAVVSVEYRFSTEAIFPAQLEDVRDAVRWVRAEGASYGLDVERIGLWGASAGAHLALLLAFGPDGRSEPGVAAVVGYFGVYELRPADQSARSALKARTPDFVVHWPLRPAFEARLLGANTVAEVPELAEQASPVAHARGDGPPVLLLHGDLDGLASIDQAQWMHDAIRSAGGESTFLTVAGANHEGVELNRPEILGATAAFLRAALR